MRNLEHCEQKEERKKKREVGEKKIWSIANIVEGNKKERE